MSLTVGAVLVAWRPTSLQHFTEPSAALILRRTPDPLPVMFSVIYYLCGGCVLTPYALGLTHWAGCALAPAHGGCAFRLAMVGGGRAWPFVRTGELRSLRCMCTRECSCPSTFGGCHIGITVQLCCGQEWVWQSWRMGMWWMGGVGALKWWWCVDGVAYYLSRCGWPTSVLTFHTHTSL